jgi:photosystem II stability/assembly factor-like uncharacterized protein
MPGRRSLVRALALIGAGGLLISWVAARAVAQQGDIRAANAAERSAASDQRVDAALYGGLRWRMIGPFRGGRVAAVSGVPGRPHEFYFGHVNGGVWKSINAGRTWTPVFDDQPVASIGALAVAPSNPDIVYVGTGESTLRDSTGYGNGVYKSTDAGRTWTRVGLDRTHHIGRIAIDPKNADVAYVAAIGNLYAASPDRGLFKTIDGGRTWKKILAPNDNVGAVDVVIDPASPKTVYASLWSTRRTPWFTYAPSNSPGGGIHKSIDGGATWKPLTAGLPAEGFGRSGLAIAPGNPRRIYAIVDAKEGGLFRSDDAGATWVKTSGDTRLWGRGWYFEKIAVDPTNPDIVFVPNVAIHKSKDAGKTFATFAVRGSPGGDDYHQLWISPSNPDVMIVASDQGAVVTLNGTADTPEWSSWYNQPTAQLYHLSITHGFPWIATAAQQDSGAVWVRSRSFTSTISLRDWQGTCAGGENGYTAADPFDPDIIYGGGVTRCNLTLNGVEVPLPLPPGPEQARSDWTQPLVFSKADPRALYYANQYVYKTSDRATWTRISDDLTRPDPGVPPTLDPTTAAQTDRNGKRGVVYTIAPSPVLKPLLWVGTDDGLMHVTMNDGGTWQNVTPPAVGPWSRVTMMEASHTDFNEAYAAVDRHQLNDFAPHIYRTRDLGKTWQEITKGLPAEGYVHTVKEDPSRRGLLVAGTEQRLFISFDDGDTWQPLQLNLPITSMRDVEFHGNDLVVATHGRGFWVLDDVSVLRQAGTAPVEKSAILFKPADAIAVIQGDDNGTPFQKDEPQAENAPVGAIVDYYLKSVAAGPVRIEILDAGGRVIRAASSADPGAPAPGPQNVSILWRPAPQPISAAAGQHRWIWDLRPAPAVGGGRGGGRGSRPAMVTGAFTVKLTVGADSYTQPLVVKPDPRDRSAR